MYKVGAYYDKNKFICIGLVAGHDDGDDVNVEAELSEESEA